MNQERLYLLLHKKLTGQLSQQEAGELSRLVEAHPEEAAALEQLWSATETAAGSYQPDVEAGLARLKKRMHQSPMEEVRTQTTRRARIWRLAMVASFLLIFGLVLWQLTAPAGPDWQVARTGPAKTEVALPDGSHVWLNAYSELTYPATFDASERNLTLKGEAFFEVVRDTERPFIIQTAEGRVQVLGTSFNVRAYPDEVFEEVYVATGKVAYAVKKDQEILEPFQKARYLKKEGVLKATADRTENPLAWKNEKLSFFKTPFREVFRVLEEQYRAEIDVSRIGHMLDCPYTNNFFDTDLKDVLQGIARIYQFELEQIGTNNYRLTGGTCN
jgi:ferric-dicitrate binding protein FerR (iron transport regulator)